MMGEWESRGGGRGVVWYNYAHDRGGEISGCAWGLLL
jgi:TnpA family transposase